MRQIQTEILVIGGGATGTGLVRDLAMRGFKTILVERRDLSHGTSGRYHGLLHSGGRYVVKDPQAAHECITENRILRRIMPQCIEDTGGFFVLAPGDDPLYAPRFVDGCQQAGIPVEEVSIAQMLQEEPRLNPGITRCFRVPDGAADSFLAAELNTASARQYGAQILVYHEVLRLVCKGSNTTGAGSQPASRICGAVCRDLIKDEEVQINADLVINAAGAWTGKIAATADIPIQIIPGKGTMLAVNHRVVNTVINRCKLPSDGDILVPAHTVAVMGTTDVKVADPDHFGIEAWEVRLMLEEGEKIIPGFRQLRILRAWAGVRPLFQETVSASQNRDVTRAFALLDHAERDGVDGLLTITSGKWTTFRKMAEVTADKACQKLGVQRPCRTHEEVLPAAAGRPVPVSHHLGHRLEEIEQHKSYGQLICECELATYQDIEQAVLKDQAQTLDDIRRQARLGMGPCQGGFCTLRAAGILHSLRHPPVVGDEKTIGINALLRDFLKERWKGVLPVLWGQQLRQERLNELIYITLLNVDHLPGPKATRLAPEMYAAQPAAAASSLPAAAPPSPTQLEKGQAVLSTAGVRPLSPSLDTLVIGAGLAGLVTAWQAAKRGQKVRLVAKGRGATHWASGCVDVLGYHPLENFKALEALAPALESFIAARPYHPYALAGLEQLTLALQEFQALCAEAGYPMLGSLQRNYLLPTALGALRPTCLIPQTMLAGDCQAGQPAFPGQLPTGRAPMLIVGFDQFLDFYPSLIAENLNAQYIFATELSLNLPSLQDRRFVSGLTLARLFDTPEFREEVAQAVKPRLGSAVRVGFPAVLGLQHASEAHRHLEALLDLPVFEIPGLPPSIPGIRLYNLLVQAIENLGGHVYDGMQVLRAETQDERITAVYSESAARQKAQRAAQFVLATGGILGGGIITQEDGLAFDTVCGLPVHVPSDRSTWFQPDFFSSTPHLSTNIGLSVNAHFQPIDDRLQPIYRNLYAAGGILGGCNPLRERSLEGIAIVSGCAVGQKVSS